MKHFFLAFIAIFFGITTIIAQSIEKTWQIEAVQNDQGVNLYNINQETDVLSLTDGDFTFYLEARDSSITKGSYITQNKLLIFYYDNPSEDITRFKIETLTDSTLVLQDKEINYIFSTPKETLVVTEAATSGIIPSQGFSMSSLLRGALGMFVLLLLSFLLSHNRKAINWKTIGFGLAAQLLLAIGVLKIPFVQKAFEIVGKMFVKVLEFTQAGSEFLLGDMMDISSFGFIFLFQVLPTIIFFSALTSLLFYLGVIQKVVSGMAWVLTKLLKISGAESLSVAGNIFLGQTEAPLMIKAYLEKMSKSEILLVMIGGMATVAGGVLAAYIGFLGGEDEALKLFYAKHLLTASVMAAPGAIVISKMLYPQQQEINTDIEVTQENIGSNVLDAIANGTTEGLKLAANVGAMLLVFIAFIAMINYGFGKLGSLTGLNTLIANNTPYLALSLEFILGYVFSPLMWLIGVAKEDMALMGQLLGIKLAASEFVGYIQLAELKNVASATHLKFEKSIIMATYMLCGFANFASIGIQIGGIGSLAPGQRKTLSEFGLKALIGGTIASLLSATIAGMIIG
ncbi:CNT family concentrative nucleoside transporter [Gelidibacter algens]|jgi:CNT family concentrative nucleoside transporter|uniref:CNT family concentrative nucleoside transporter n=1 Tax=Gelidibacter algens TaxID=49280 RepID=A0A1A7R1D5_9FLAO|nr:nucleoside transporter C-terminal domain-containing protein [Gelidibacter algens]OBX25636.1 Na+ dependent nucleoside transporter [Gelidibacter algens]RAJ22567.1 CNT family concentrative nucleoside transporter [Gelidibacter algens]